MSNVLVTGGAGFIGSHVTGELLKSTTFVEMKEVNIIIPTFAKLLATSIVANSFSGDSRFLSVVRPALDLLFFSFRRSFGLSEKYATSEPLISAETNKSRFLVNLLRRTVQIRVNTKEPD